MFFMSKFKILLLTEKIIYFFMKIIVSIISIIGIVLLYNTNTYGVIQYQLYMYWYSAIILLELLELLWQKLGWKEYIVWVVSSVQSQAVKPEHKWNYFKLKQ